MWLFVGKIYIKQWRYRSDFIISIKEIHQIFNKYFSNGLSTPKNIVYRIRPPKSTVYQIGIWVKSGENVPYSRKLPIFSFGIHKFSFLIISQYYEIHFMKNVMKQHWYKKGNEEVNTFNPKGGQNDPTFFRNNLFLKSVLKIPILRKIITV